MKGRKISAVQWGVCLVMSWLFMCFVGIQAYAKPAVTIPEGTYTIRSAMDNNMVVDVYGGYSDAGTNIQLYQSNNRANQQFYFTPVGENWYKVTSLVGRGMSLDVYGGKSNPGSNVCLWEYHNQLWRFIPCGDGTFMIQSNLGLYLDVEKAECRNEANIIAYSQNGNANQRWVLDAIAFYSQYEEDAYIPNGTYIIRSAMDSNMVIDAYQGEEKAGTNIQLYSDNDGNNQRFEFRHMGGNWYRVTVPVKRIILDANRMSLDVYGGQGVAGSNVCLWNYHDQLWQVLPCIDGTYLIKSHLGLYLDVEKAECRNGANIVAYSRNVNANQRWWLDAVK